jgi:hypothetical protein
VSSNRFAHSSRLITGAATELSIGAWVYCFAAPQSEAIIAEFESTGDVRAFALFWGGTANQLIFRISPDGTSTEQTDVSDTSAIWEDTWNHIIVTYNGASTLANIYINNSLAATSLSMASSITSKTGAILELGASDGGSTLFDGMLSDVVLEEAVWDSDTRSAVYAGNPPTTSWRWRDGDEQEYNQGLADLTPTGTPDRIIVPQGILPVSIGPGVGHIGQSFDLGGGQSNSPYAQQLNAIITNLTYNVGDDDDADAEFARLLDAIQHEGDDRLLTVLPAAAGADLSTLQTYTGVG